MWNGHVIRGHIAESKIPNDEELPARALSDTGTASMQWEAKARMATSPRGNALVLLASVATWAKSSARLDKRGIPETF